LPAKHAKHAKRRVDFLCFIFRVFGVFRGQYLFAGEILNVQITNQHVKLHFQSLNIWREQIINSGV